jgi:hypothetical protein
VPTPQEYMESLDTVEWPDGSVAHHGAQAGGPQPQDWPPDLSTCGVISPTPDPGSLVLVCGLADDLSHHARHTRRPVQIMLGMQTSKEAAEAMRKEFKPRPLAAEQYVLWVARS